MQANFTVLRKNN